ncbi:MAG: hypothetical protein ACRD01_01335, partial [Terriglobales bacterium]
MNPGYRDFPRESQNSCLMHYLPLACAPMILALENHGARAVRSGLMTCAPRPITFQLRGDDGAWHDSGSNEHPFCTRNFMVWHTIPPGGRYAFGLRAADSWGLRESDLGGRGPHMIRVVWNVLGCAAGTPRPRPAPSSSGMDLYLWEAQCAGGTKPQSDFARLVSNPVTLDFARNPAGRGGARPLAGVAPFALRANSARRAAKVRSGESASSAFT